MHKKNSRDNCLHPYKYWASLRASIREQISFVQLHKKKFRDSCLHPYKYWACLQASICEQISFVQMHKTIVFEKRLHDLLATIRRCNKMDPHSH